MLVCIDPVALAILCHILCSNHDQIAGAAAAAVDNVACEHFADLRCCVPVAVLSSGHFDLYCCSDVRS